MAYGKKTKKKNPKQSERPYYKSDSDQEEQYPEFIELQSKESPLTELSLLSFFFFFFFFFFFSIKNKKKTFLDYDSPPPFLSKT